jgi:hypothetical protein
MMHVESFAMTTRQTAPSLSSFHFDRVVIRAETRFSGIGTKPADIESQTHHKP